MTHYALLCGTAPDGMRQKKLIEMHEFLTATGGTPVPQKNVVSLPNGADEFLLEYALNNILSGTAGDDAGEIFLYICTDKPVLEKEEPVWLCGSEIRKEVLEYFSELAKKVGFGFQIVYDVDNEFVSEESLGYERMG